MAQRKGGLGRGLDAIFEDNSSETGESSIKLKISEIEPNRSQPRQAFDQDALRELADSIAAVGIIQPLIVRPITGGGYQIVAGERRWRASQMAGLKEVPAIIRDLTDREVAELALIENLQREDLNPVEEAEGYRHLMREYGMTQEEVSERVGKSRPAIANSVRLLELPDAVLNMVESGELTPGHVRPLLTLPGEEDMVRIATQAQRKMLSVREVEKLVRAEKAGPKKETRSRERDSFYDEVQIALSQELSRKIRVTTGKNGGVLEIPFTSKDELADLARLLAPED